MRALFIPSVSPSLRSMWLLKQLSGVVVSRRCGFLRPVSIATHSSSRVLLPTSPVCHTTKPSPHPLWPIAASELRWNGHRVDPLGLLLSLQPLREIKPTWVCVLSVCPFPSDCLRRICLSLPWHGFDTRCISHSTFCFSISRIPECTLSFFQFERATCLF